MKYNEDLTNRMELLIKTQVDLKESSQGFLRGDCPFCEGKYTFGINPETGRSNCFKCDEAKTTLITCIMKLFRLETYQDFIKLANSQQDYGPMFRPNRTKEVVEVKAMDFPEGYHLISMGDNIYARAARNYMINKRGFKLSTLERLGIGYCDDGDHCGYIIIPYYEKGKLVYFTSRRYMGSGPKFLNPSKEEYGIGKETLIYNLDCLWLYNKVYVVESATNAITLGDNGAVLGGKSISPYQKDQLYKSPASKLVIGLDPDALKEAYRLALDMVEFKKVKVLELPEGKDINNIGKVAAKELEKNTPYLNYHGLYKKYKYYSS